MTAAVWRVSGEVIEREELLDGRCQVVLDGEAEPGDDPDAGSVAFAVSLVWLLGREGEVELSEGYATVVDAERGELNASLAAGSVIAGDETGAAQVRASFVVDALDGTLAAEGDGVACDLEVGVEEWSGELRLSGDAD